MVVWLSYYPSINFVHLLDNFAWSQWHVLTIQTYKLSNRLGIAAALRYSTIQTCHESCDAMHWSIRDMRLVVRVAPLYQPTRHVGRCDWQCYFPRYSTVHAFSISQFLTDTIGQSSDLAWLHCTFYTRIVNRPTLQFGWFSTHVL